ncbi:hypothetical protein HMPREF1548_02364 [Clostridium sp. KLE 1755]|nr:hypothetical protein HMPREF1548_02364 [Clostridium sp. KLE 1755]
MCKFFSAISPPLSSFLLDNCIISIKYILVNTLLFIYSVYLLKIISLISCTFPSPPL